MNHEEARKVLVAAGLSVSTRYGPFSGACAMSISGLLHAHITVRIDENGNVDAGSIVEIIRASPE